MLMNENSVRHIEFYSPHFLYFSFHFPMWDLIYSFQHFLPFIFKLQLTWSSTLGLLNQLYSFHNKLMLHFFLLTSLEYGTYLLQADTLVESVFTKNCKIMDIFNIVWMVNRFNVYFNIGKIMFIDANYVVNCVGLLISCDSLLYSLAITKITA